MRRDGRVISAMVSYPITDLAPKKELQQAQPLFQPLIALESLAVPSWYINALATLPDACGSGAATALPRTAAGKARTAGFSRLSLITEDINPARRLHKGLGFGCAAHRPIVKEGWRYSGDRWRLFIKDVLAPLAAD
ncbi:MAG: GNAT family N-acetyltransferase [Rhodobacteraceae bacterium]|nr:GNAT family N-acetyltransferase [Paracoccaceae bacterium]